MVVDPRTVTSAAVIVMAARRVLGMFVPSNVGLLLVLHNPTTLQKSRQL